MNSRVFRVLFLCEWKSKRYTAAAARSINATFENGSVNERTIQSWYAKFETGDESLTNEDLSRPETVEDNDVLRAIVKNNPGNTVRDYAEELGISPTTISHNLKLIGKVKKMDKWVSHELRENHESKHFELSSALLRKQNDPFLNQFVTFDEM